MEQCGSLNIPGQEGTVVRMDLEEKLEVSIVPKKLSNQEFNNTLAEIMMFVKIGVSEDELVNEALIILHDKINMYFQNIGGMSEDVQTVMSSVESQQDMGSFSRFAYGIYQGCKPPHDEKLFSAIESSIKVFWDVLKAAAADNPGNKALQWMVSDGEDTEIATVYAWNKLFEITEERHQQSHQVTSPFGVIGGFMDVAQSAIAALKYIAKEMTENDKYKRISHLIEASIPFVVNEVQKNTEEAKRRDEVYVATARRWLPRRKTK